MTARKRVPGLPAAVPPLMIESPLVSLLDMKNLQQLTMSFSEAVGVSSAIIDLDGKVLAASRWQRLCMDFHRANEIACARCIESDTHLALNMGKGEDFSIYNCRNGLTDAASPVIVGGRHLANVFVGQFLRSPPDRAFFRHQAREFDFDPKEYLQALEEVPIVSAERLPAILDFMRGFASLISASGNERRQLYEEMQKNLEQERLLIQQSRYAAMGEMIGNIAHQWRQPLDALNLLLANIKDSYEFNELNRETLGRYVHQGRQLTRKMSSTIDDFRNFFRPAKEKTAFSLKQALEEGVGLLGASLVVHNIVLTVEGEEDVIASGHANEYSQVLVNLLNNAKDVIAARKIAHGEIRVRITREDDMAVLTIRDNGGGIPEETLPRLFEQYFTTKEQGTGIGLYMSRLIVENSMGGRIEGRNVEGGAEFTIACPLAAAAAMTAPRRAPPG